MKAKGEIKDPKKYHSIIADYFNEKPLFLNEHKKAIPNLRKIIEQPWHSLQIEDWKKLFEILSDLEFFKSLWENDKFDTKQYWNKTNTNYRKTIINAYENVIINPDKYNQYLWPIAILLTDLGYLKESINLKYYLIEYFRKSDHSLNLQASLGNTAVSLIRLSRYDEAEKLIREQLKICHELDCTDISLPTYNLGLICHLKLQYEEAEKLFNKSYEIASDCRNQHVKGLSLGKQAVLIREKGDPENALELHIEEEKIFRAENDIDALQGSLGNQALAYLMLSDTNNAKSRLKRQQKICRQIGNYDDLFNSLYNEALMQIQNFDRPDLALPLIEEAYKISIDKRMTSLSKELLTFLDQLRSFNREIPYKEGFSDIKDSLKNDNDSQIQNIKKIPWWKKIF